MPLRLNSKKRPNYFTGQLLGQEDFQSEQNYHLELHRGHTRSLHTWGVVSGLGVTRADDATILVSPGSALDAKGRLIILDAAQSLVLQPVHPDGAVRVTVSYEEEFQDPDRSTDDTQGFTRVTEVCVLQQGVGGPDDEGTVVELAKVQFAGGKIASIDTSSRRQAGVTLAPGSVGTLALSPAAVTLDKLGAELRSGWVRLPFKPSSFVEPQKAALDFFIGVTKTYCDQHGAKGTMAIPIPMLADRLKTFVIAGERNETQISLELDRCGWDNTQNIHEKTTLLKTQIGKKSPFYESFAINKSIDRANHALALYVEAAGDASISLIAAEFEYATTK
jgi:hypothetical protein